MANRPVLIRLDDRMYEDVREKARIEVRTVANWVRVAIMEKLERESKND